MDEVLEAVTVRAAVPAVWASLVDPDGRRQWWSYLELEPAEGGSVLERWTNEGGEAMTTTGGVLHAGGVPQAAEFEAVSPVRTVIVIRIPRDPITLTRIGGTETMTVSNWTMSGNARRTVAAFEAVPFKVGGRLNVNAGQVEGTYVGTFDVEVQYP